MCVSSQTPKQINKTVTTFKQGTDLLSFSSYFLKPLIDSIMMFYDICLLR